MNNYDRLIDNIITTIAKDNNGDPAVTKLAVVSFAHTLIGAAQSSRYIDLIANQRTEEPHYNLRVIRLLREMGLSVTYKGYEYTRIAVLMTIDNSRVMTDIVHDVYEPLAISHGTKAYCVAQCVGKVIDIARRANTSTWQRLFPDGRPTPKTFITTIAEEVQR